MLPCDEHLFMASSAGFSVSCSCENEGDDWRAWLSGTILSLMSDCFWITNTFTVGYNLINLMTLFSFQPA